MVGLKLGRKRNVFCKKSDGVVRICYMCDRTDAHTLSHPHTCAGSADAAKLFNSSVKQGTPVFVLQGSGGAANKLALVLKHMHWRKELDDHAVDEDGDEFDEIEASCLQCLVSCFRKSNAATHAGATDESDEHFEEDQDRWLNLGVMIQRLEEKDKACQAAFDKLHEEGQFDLALPQKKITVAVKSTLEKALELKGRFLDAIQQAKVATCADKAYDNTLAEIHAQYLLLIEEYEVRISPHYKPVETDDSESVGSASKAGSTHGMAEGLVQPTRRADTPEAVYREDLRVAKEGLAWEIRNRTTFSQWHRDG